MVVLTKSEKKILRKIRRWLMGYRDPYPYSFWFVYNTNHEAIGWEGGFYGAARKEPPFRNKYTILGKQKRIVKNY